jgi:hypothetical protein
MKPILKLLLLADLAALAACSTVVPKGVTHSEPSLSVTGQDSGVLSVNPAGGAYVNATWVGRYNALISQGWGKHFTPAIVPNQGLTAQPFDSSIALGVSVPVWLATNQALEWKGMMEWWVSKGAKP